MSDIKLIIDTLFLFSEVFFDIFWYFTLIRPAFSVLFEAPSTSVTCVKETAITFVKLWSKSEYFAL